MSKAQVVGNKEKNGTQRDVMTQPLLPFPDRSREMYACDVVRSYFPLTGILQ